MPPKVIRVLRAGHHTGNALLALLGVVVFTVAGLASSTYTPPGRATAASPKPGAASPVRAPLARPQGGESNKLAALERDRELQARNAADAARAAEIRAEIARLETKLESGAMGRKRRAKLEAKRTALSAELAALDPRLVTAMPRIVAEAEPNDDPREATALDALADRLVVASGAISRPGERDVFAFDAPAGARVWAYLDATASSGTRDSVLRVLDRDGVAVIAESDDGASGSDLGLKAQTVLASVVAGASVPATGRLFLEVRAFDAAATMDSYKLVLVVTTAEARPETSGNESVDAATPLVAAGTPGGTVAAALERAGDVDVYSIRAASGHPIFVALDADPDRTGVATDVALELRDRDGSTVLSRTAVSGAVAPGGALAIMPPATGTYYLRATSGGSNAVGKYLLMAAAATAPRGNEPIPVGPFCGDTGDSALMQVDSMDQDGVASTCNMPKACPGGGGPSVPYVAFPFTNNTGADACVTVNVTSPCTGNSRAVVGAYLGSFDPNNICTNYLADPGANLGSGTTVTFSFIAPAGETFVIVVNAARPGNDCGEFCFTLGAETCTIECPQDIVVNTGTGNTQCGANVQFETMSPCSTTAPTCTDQNGNPVVSGDLFPVGTTTVTCTEGQASCSFMVTVVDDTPPAVTCPAPTTASADGNCQGTVPNVLPGVTAADNCSTGDSITLMQSPTAGTLVPVGTTTITVTATDAAGNQSTCTTTFTVQDQVQPAVTCPSNITTSASAGACAATVNYTTPTGTDNCGTPTVACVPASGSSFPVGTTTVTCTATDASGNTGTCTFTVTVNDLTNPAVTCPSNITASAPAGSCTATVNYTTPTGTDNCGTPTVVCVPSSGSSFPVGTTTVTCTATDASGNTGSCTFTVTVNDVTGPTLTCPSNVTTTATGGTCAATVNYNTPLGNDACSGETTATCVPASGSSFPVGTTTVTCTATDASGNTGSCTFTVTVTDNTNPAVTCPSNITTTASGGACAATVNYTTPTGTDNCGTPTVACVPASGSSFPVGTTTVTCTATDASGNTGTCTFTVTVTDAAPPAVTCPSNIMANAPAGTCSATVNYTTPAGTDNCGTPTVMCVPASGSSFPVGTTTVTCTATDASGNMGTCSFTVTVRDATAPAITCPSNVVVQPPVGVCNPVVNYPAPMATDACSMPTVVCAPASGSMFPLGTTTVTCTATDSSNNSSSCTFTVTVAGPPFTITCPPNVTATGGVPMEGTCGLGAVVNYPAPTITSSACNGTVTVTCTPASGTVFPAGTTTVTCTATDQLGQSLSCSFTVTVSGAAFGTCYVDDFSGDTFRQVVDPTSLAYGYWEYRVNATGEIICGIAEFVVYTPGRSHITYDNDASNVWMDANVNLGTGAAVIQVNTFSPYRRFILRDRNVYNNPPCQ